MTDWLEVSKVAAPVLVGFGVAWATARAGVAREREQRRQARLDRAYASAARYATDMRQYATVARAGLTDDHDDDELLPPKSPPSDHWERHALMELYGSRAAREAYDRLLTAVASLRTAVATFSEEAARRTVLAGELRARRDAYEAYKTARVAALVASNDFLEILRREVNPKGK